MSRSLSTALATYLSNRAFIPVDLYEIVVGGTTYRFTTHGSALTGVAPAAVATYSPGVMQVEGQRAASGIVVDDLEVTVLHGGSEQLGGVSWAARAMAWELDGAPFKRYEGFVDASTGLLAGCVLAFEGDVSEAQPRSTTLRLVVSVPSKRFDGTIPNLIVEAGCIHNLGSAGCGYAGAMEFTSTLIAGSNASNLKIASLPAGMPGTTPQALHFQDGAAKIGAYSRMVSSTQESPIILGVAPSFPSGVAVAGATVTLRLGCRKTAAICESTIWGYERLANYLGAPLAPAEVG